MKKKKNKKYNKIKNKKKNTRIGVFNKYTEQVVNVIFLFLNFLIYYIKSIDIRYTGNKNVIKLAIRSIFLKINNLFFKQFVQLI